MALEHARAKNYAKLTVVVLDDSGNVKAVQREDGAISVLVDRFFAVDAARALAVPSRDFH